MDKVIEYLLNKGYKTTIIKLRKQYYILLEKDLTNGEKIELETDLQDSIAMALKECLKIAS